MTRITLPLKYSKYNRILINRFYRDTSNVLKSYFVERFRKYRCLYSFSSLEEAYEVIGSTYLVFISSVLISKYRNTTSDVHSTLLDNFYFTMMYSLVDTLLDTGSKDKVRCIASIRSILYEGKIPDSEKDPLINALYEIYSHFSNRKQVIEAMKLSFLSEYNSYLVQYKQCEEKDYNDVCEEIGYTMYELFKSINNVSGEEKYDRIIGYGGQLCDNITDMDDDIKAGINTIVTHVYQKEGNLDRLYYEMIEKIKTIPENLEYGIIKYALTYGFYYVVNKSRYISDNIKMEIRDYTFRPYTDDINKNAGKGVYDLL